jgi:hypothetical protein
MLATVVKRSQRKLTSVAVDLWDTGDGADDGTDENHDSVNFFVSFDALHILLVPVGGFDSHRMPQRRPQLSSIYTITGPTTKPAMYPTALRRPRRQPEG